VSINTTLELYERSAANIWTDAYISQNMLKAHLDLEHDGASRNIQTIRRTVDWIDSVSEGKRKLVDLGCGPGIYADLLADKGYEITGIDISEQSIAYARRWAEREKKTIDYNQSNYIVQGISGTYQMAICVYCDFGALIPVEQIQFLINVRNALQPGGLLIFDVFGLGLCNWRKEGKSLKYVQESDFWTDTPHFLLEERIHYPIAMVWGSRTTVIEKSSMEIAIDYQTWNRDSVKNDHPDVVEQCEGSGQNLLDVLDMETNQTKQYITWDSYYTDGKITGLLAENGFVVEEIKKDLVAHNEFASEDVNFVKARRV